MRRVLIYEPDSELAEKLQAVVQSRSAWALVVPSIEAALENVQKQFFHLCIWASDSPEQIDTIYQLKNHRPVCAVIATSVHNLPSYIVGSIRAGASNYWLKNPELTGFAEVLDDTLLRIAPAELTWEGVDFPLPDFVGRHPKILEIFQLILSIRNTDSTVLITGESGTGKEVVARAIHQLSPRKKHPWVAINCSAIPGNLLESELFGHMKGAFTGATHNRPGRFQLAGAGTLFLDEISDLSFDLQAKILRAIHNRVYEPVGSSSSFTLEARIIAASNQDLQVAVAEKRFRQDLFYRLNVIPIYIPPLRNRKSDIPLLVHSFLSRFCKNNQREFRGISEEAMQVLMQYYWPGNIRELENLIERVVVLKKGEGIVELKDFPVDQFQNVRLDRFIANVALPEDGLDFNDAVNEFENELILQALQRTSGNKNRAATLLNLNRTTLVEKLKRKGLRLVG